ncbi:hypothetical protein D3C86_1446860 [compost metagenome]
MLDREVELLPLKHWSIIHRCRPLMTPDERAGSFSFADSSRATYSSVVSRGSMTRLRLSWCNSGPSPTPVQTMASARLLAVS